MIPKFINYYFVLIDDWRVDGYRWYQNGTKPIPNSKPLYKKIHFVIVLESGRDLRFKKHAYFLMDPKKANLILIHYIGDESIAIDFPHKNRKNSNHNYQRICPSVLQQLASDQDLPSNVYKKMISSSTALTLPPSHLPRNTRQIVNLQHMKRQQSRLSHDALYNLHELSLDLNGFVKIINTYPDLVVVCGLDTILNEMAIVLRTKSTNYQLLSYDTTFQLGDFYVSPFLFRYTSFKTSPVIPAAFLIHERKFQSCHEELMKVLF